jgi:multiple sugar transport system ATP-binding protein
MIYVTHDQTEAMTLGERIAVMNQGRLQQVADPMTLYHKPANMFVAGFIGSPPMNFFTGTVVERGSTVAFQEANGKGDMPPKGISLRLQDLMPDMVKRFMGKKIVMGIRPEHIHASRQDNSETSIKAMPDAIMPVGPEIYVQASSAAHSFVARLPAPTTINAKETIELAFDVRFAHFFDPESQNRVI